MSSTEVNRLIYSRSQACSELPWQRRLEVVRQTGCAMGVAFHLCRMALMIAYRLVQFWTGYFKQIEDAGGFDFERAAASAATRRLKRRRILFPPKRN